MDKPVDYITRNRADCLPFAITVGNKRLTVQLMLGSRKGQVPGCQGEFHVAGRVSQISAE